MKIEIRESVDGLAATLVDRDDFSSFAVVVLSNADASAGSRTSDGAVRFESEEQAWVDQDWLGRVGEFDKDESLAGSYTKMLAYAGQKGWIDPETGAVAAHVERPD
jgi:hypothetical protein